jgi:hypothetical protein
VEVYAGVPERISHTIFHYGELLVEAGSVQAIVSDESGESMDPRTATLGDDGMWFVEVVTNDYSPQFIHWTYEVGGVMFSTVREPFTVINPVTNYDHFRSQYPNAHISSPGAETSYGTFRRLERAARKIIERYCNQSFTREDDATVTVVGQDSDRLALPKRLIRLEDVSSGFGDSTLPSPGTSLLSRVTWDDGDPWSLRLRQGQVSRRLTPVSTARLFKYPTVYRITGDWGWASVPQDVYHAADIIINDLTHPDAKYREKMANVVRAADWRIEFAETGMETTGNANADMLLSQYRHISLGVI